MHPAPIVISVYKLCRKVCDKCAFIGPFTGVLQACETTLLNTYSGKIIIWCGASPKLQRNVSSLYNLAGIILWIKIMSLILSYCHIFFHWVLGSIPAFIVSFFFKKNFKQNGKETSFFKFTFSCGSVSNRFENFLF